MPITIDNPAHYTVAPTAGFIPDRIGVRKVIIDVDRNTGVTRTVLTPCPATADHWGPTDAPEVSSPDLASELLSAPDSAAKLAALQAMQRIQSDLVTVAGFVLSLRK